MSGMRTGGQDRPRIERHVLPGTDDTYSKVSSQFFKTSEESLVNGSIVVGSWEGRSLRICEERREEERQ